jgi:hypothetical protein
MRLFLLISKEPYPTCKRLLKAIQEKKESEKILNLLYSIKSLLGIKEFIITEKKIKEYIN